jgi:hypothetical protein
VLTITTVGSPSRVILSAHQMDFDFLDTPPMPNDEFDQNRREFLLDLYFAHSYSEQHEPGQMRKDGA